MFSAAWLALLAPPVYVLPLPQAPELPAAMALATGRAELRTPCLALRCRDAEWQPPSPASTYAFRGEDQPVRRSVLPGQASPGPRLRASASRRDWVAGDGNAARLGARYGIDAIRTPDTRLTMEVGTGYRLQPYADDGIADTGVVARGYVEWRRTLAPWAALTQQLRVETGRGDTVVRTRVGVDVELLPQWTLRSSVDTRHDSAGNGGRGVTDSNGTVQLRYVF